MVLEATMICIDNSEHMRNGDFSPSRFEAQQDACNLICGVKTRANVENTVGLVTTAGKSPEVCVSLTQDLGKILSSLHRVKICGEADIVSAVMVASLALRHRQNKRQEQRIVLFVGSPISATEAELKRLGAQLKKNKIALDVINFGEGAAEENRARLEAFVAAANNHDNSHIVTLPPGERDAAASADAGLGDGSALDEFGIDPNVDPELAMAMRLSLETAEAERRAREAAASGQSAPAASEVPPFVDAMDLDDDPELRAALELSLQTAQADMARERERANAEQSAPSAGGSEVQDVEMADEEDEELALALKLSRETASSAEKKAEEASEKEASGAPANVDPQFMASVLMGLPGVDPSSPEVQEMVRQMQNQGQTNGDQGKKEEK